MKKLTVYMAAVALLCSNVAQAQESTPAPKSAGAVAASSKRSGWVTWGIGFAGLAVLGVVVGVTVAAATSTPSTSSH